MCPFDFLFVFPFNQSDTGTLARKDENLMTAIGGRESFISYGGI